MIKFDELHPILQNKAKKLIRLGKEKCNLEINIYSGFRSFAAQEAIYAQGRTAPGKVISNARGGESFHNYGLGFDFAILKPGSKEIEWNSRADVDNDQKPDYEEIGKLGEDLGMEWGARFTNMKGDWGHLQMSFGFSIKDLQIYYFGGLKAVYWAIKQRT